VWGRNIVMENHAKSDGVIMNFNHLIERKQLQAKCGKSNTECYYVPIGHARTMLGENVHLTMMCRRCTKRKDIFLTKEEYFMQQKLINKEIENA